MPASAARSGNPAKRATAAKKAPADRKPARVSSAAEWAAEDTEILEFPSGLSAEIERIELTTLVAEGLLGDSLSVIASQAVDKGQGMDENAIRDMANDPTKVEEALDAFDRVAVKCFVDPPVLFYKDDEGKVIPRPEREPGRVYSDRIQLNDKIFLFQVITGGSSDLQRFRDEFSESLAGLSAR